MSKKRFTDGLESLFGFSEGGNLPEESPLLAKTEVAIREKSTPARKKRGKSSKNFTSDLDSLFADVLQETIEERQEKTIAPGAAKSKKKKSRRPVSGLDALIRRTLDTGEAEITYEKRKRVTFVFDREKVDKLKRIAKSQKMFMKDILKEIVEEFIEDFEKTGNKGTLN